MRRIRRHPGEVLREEFLVPLNMSANQLAEAIGVPANRISDIARERRGVSADTALRLGKHLRAGSSNSRPLGFSTLQSRDALKATEDALQTTMEI